MSNANNYKGGTFIGDDLFQVDGDFSVAVPVGMPRISFPLEGDSQNAQALTAHVLYSSSYADIAPFFAANLNAKCFIIDQDFEVAGDWFEPLALNTPYDIGFSHDYAGSLPLASAILVAESAQQDRGQGIVRWTRTYVYMDFSTSIDGPNGPVNSFVWNDYESIPFTFPALGADPGAGLPASDQFPDEVEARVERLFFVDDGFNRPFRFFGFYPFISASGPAYPSDNTVTGDTSPTLTDYLLWVANEDEIVVRPSILRRWRGNIYELVTYYAPAE